MRSGVVLFLCLSVFLSVAWGAPSRPNVVIVITDDQGYGDLSCHGNPVLKTPHLDALHGDAFRFTDFHVSPTCSPTRGALMTGQSANRTGVWHTILGRSSLKYGIATMAEAFQEAGYGTGMFGKWHLGDNYPSRPQDKGFDLAYYHGGGGVGQTPDYWDNSYFDGSYFRNGVAEKAKGFCTDVFFGEAQKFIQSQKAQGKPFFTYISTNAPHSPYHAPEKYAELYKGVKDVNVQHFLGMIANIDDNVGQLRGFLKEEGLDRDTLFIFMTDNGTARGGKIFNAGMKRYKGSEYDGGHRVPFFLRWPAGNMIGGQDVEELCAHIDIFPTMIELCGLKAPSEHVLEGVSFAPLLRGEKGGVKWDERVVITDSQRLVVPEKWRKSAVMTKRWRLVNGNELYEIAKDPGQAKNIADAHPEVVQSLRKAYDAWWADLEPTFADTPRIHLGNEAENPAILTCMDWVSEAPLTPWNQSHIRGVGVALAGGGKASEKHAKMLADLRGRWEVMVEKPGKYEIRLRRWPEESGFAISSQVEPASDVPGEAAYRTTEGQAFEVVEAEVAFGGVRGKVEVAQEAEEVKFVLELKAGKQDFQADFLCKDGKKVGAFFAYVEFLGGS